MREVSNRSVVFLRDACAREGISFVDLAAGLPVERIDRLGEHTDWEVFAELLERFWARAGGVAALEEAGARTVDDAFAESIRVIAGAFASSRVLYKAIVHWFAPAAVRNVVLGYAELPRGRLRITLEVPEPHRASTPFLHLTLGSYRAAPRLLGQHDAIVDMVVEGRRATYVITPPPDLTLLARAGRSLRAALGGRRAIEELSGQQAALRASYEALLASRRDFRVVIDGVPNGVLIHRDGVVIYANPFWERTLGVDVTGRRIEALVSEPWRSTVSTLVQAPAAGGEATPLRGVQPAEVPFVGAGGRPVTLELFPAATVQFDGEPSCVVVAHDVTERKELEAKASLADRMAAIGTIAAGVAHEINNPLTYVIDNVRRLREALAQETPTATRAELAQMASEAAGGVERVEVIVRDLKTFSRVDGESVGAVDVRAVLESTARIAANEIRLRARLVQSIGDVPPATGNASRLGQVILNLLINAAQAIPEGRASENEVRISAGRAGERVRIEVADTGVGIPEEHLARIFEPFFTTKPLGVGTGLGLTICHSIVSAMGGEITVESEVGKGTTFRIELPVAEARPQRARSTAPPRATGQRRRILVVDDEPLIASTLKRALGAHDVSVAHDGQAALAEIVANDFDLVLCDLMMPGLSGMDLYERLTPAQRRRVVFMTGGAFTARAQRFLADLGRRTVDKPIDLRSLKRLVEEFDASEDGGAEGDVPPADDGGARG